MTCAMARGGHYQNDNKYSHRHIHYKAVPNRVQKHASQSGFPSAAPERRILITSFSATKAL